MVDLVSLPQEVRNVCESLTSGLIAALGDKLYGVYLYGASVFEDGSAVHDIDCHVVLHTEFVEEERRRVSRLHANLADEYPRLGEELDAYYILLEAAGKPEKPQHQLDPTIYDNAWALHCAHVRAGFYATMYGPEPDTVFPAPTWEAIVEALDHELEFVRANLHHPAYCILNLCRVVFSFQTGNAAVSKRACARWAGQVYPTWAALIASAARDYDGSATAVDADTMQRELPAFLHFIEGEIRLVRE